MASRPSSVYITVPGGGAPQQSASGGGGSVAAASIDPSPRVVHPTAKRVLIPQSRTGGVPGAAPTVVSAGGYRTQQYAPSPRCSAYSRLESAAEEHPEASGRRQVPQEFMNRGYRPDKSRGLRHFSTKVCEKVKEKGRTNYNEVADELVAEYFDSSNTVPAGAGDKQQYDMKNIRRRVYDALNVLMAMNIIEKEKKEIRWVGLPTSSHQECRRLEEEKLARQESIKRKTEQLQELLVQLVSYKSLVNRNRAIERESGRLPDSKLLFLPFIVINTNKDTIVDCSIASDKTEYMFNFDQPFEIHDDIEILKRMGLAYGLDKGNVDSAKRETIRECLPPALRDYADQIIDGNLIIEPPKPKPPPVPVPQYRPLSGRQGVQRFPAPQRAFRPSRLAVPMNVARPLRPAGAHQYGMNQAPLHRVINVPKAPNMYNQGRYVLHPLKPVSQKATFAVPQMPQQAGSQQQQQQNVYAAGSSTDYYQQQNTGGGEMYAPSGSGTTSGGQVEMLDGSGLDVDGSEGHQDAEDGAIHYE